MNEEKPPRYLPDFRLWQAANLESLARDLLLKVWELEDRLEAAPPEAQAAWEKWTAEQIGGYPTDFKLSSHGKAFSAGYKAATEKKE